jgi:hypothetical protein
MSLSWNMWMPVLFGLPTLTVKSAIYVASLVSILFIGRSTIFDKEEKTSRIVGKVIDCLISPWIIYLVCYLAYIL